MAAVLIGIVIIIIGVTAWIIQFQFYHGYATHGETSANTVYLSHEILKRLDKIDAKIESLDKRLSVVESAELVNVRERQEKLEKEISTIKTIGNDLEQHKRAMEEFAKTFLESNINDLKKMIKTTDDKLSVEIGEKIELKLKMQEEFRDLKAETEERSKQMQDVHKDQNVMRENLKVLAENINGISIELHVLDQKTEDMKERNYENGFATLTVMANTVLLALLIIYVFFRKDENRPINLNVQTSAEQAIQTDNDEPKQYSMTETILRQIQVRTLSKGLCIISFHEETHPMHMRMTMSVVSTFQLEPVEFIVSKHVSILDIPPVCLYWMFVDSNKQNVILEDPNLGRGDLRVTTVRAIQKMGGKVVVLYVGDLNSGQLQYEQLYNPDLVSIAQHQDLSTLNQRLHVLSAYDTLTEFQKQSLRKTVTVELNLQSNLSSDLSVNHSVVE